MIKVLLIGPQGETGGVAKYVKDLMEADIGVKMDLFDISRLKSKAKYHAIGYKAFTDLGVIRLLKSLLITVFNLLRFPWILLRKQPDIIHICGTSYYMFWEKSVYLLIAKLLRKKVVLHFLGALDQYYDSVGKMERSFIRCILNKTDKLALLSDKVKILVSEFIPESKLIVIRSSVDIQNFYKSDDLMEFYDNKFTDFLFLGGADPKRKGLDVIINAIPLVLENKCDIRFILTGSDNIKASVEKLISQNESYVSHIFYLGWLNESEKYAVYRSVDAFLLPSFNEGLPYTVIEALAAKLPVIATPVGGIPEVIENDVNGYLVDFNDHAGLAESILKLYKDQDKLKKMSINNFEKAKQYYSLNVVFKQLNEVYNDLRK